MCFIATKEILFFIALIHPIQWTIPVGTDRSAKRQKKTSCVSTGWAGPVLCTRQVACRTSFLSRQRDVIASFSFGACIVYTKFLRKLFGSYILYCQSVPFNFMRLVSEDFIDLSDIALSDHYVLS